MYDDGITFLDEPTTHRHHRCVHVDRRESNGLGVAGFVVSLFGLLTLGLLAPVSLLLSGLALFKRPRGFAVAGTILSLIPLSFYALTYAYFQRAAVAEQSVARLDSTLAKLAQASSVIERFAVVEGRLPNGIEGNKLILDIHDGWDQSLQYQRDASNRFSIRSAGADGVFDNGDDRVHAVNTGASETTELIEITDEIPLE